VKTAKPRVELPAALADAIRAEARRAAPHECCGLLEGVRTSDGFIIQALHPARNLSDDPDRFAIDPRDHFSALRAARANRRAIIGCYHSHPRGRAEPSVSDRTGAEEDNFLWLIAAGGAVNAFVYFGGEFLGADCVTSSE
jgi:proteasome lid subunit RPN8/RPN11